MSRNNKVDVAFSESTFFFFNIYRRCVFKAGFAIRAALGEF